MKTTIELDTSLIDDLSQTIKVSELEEKYQKIYKNKFCFITGFVEAILTKALDEAKMKNVNPSN